MTPDRNISLTISSVDQLEKRLGADWGHIRSARTLARRKRDELKAAFSGFDSEDTSIVVFGSLARDEFTDNSDIDWTLLIDGSANPKHHDLANRVDQIIKKAAERQPGREKTFGTMAFSHDLVHQIGGEDDTNRNTTQRILLLLESAVVGRPEAHKRVITCVLERYLTEDDAFIQGTARHHVPRFLLNDFARYWRTMAVDFAYKRRARLGEGAALRNIKLRMSRKLIFVSGLLACFSCELGLGCNASVQECKRPQASVCIDCLQRFMQRTPLEILASTLSTFDGLDDVARRLFDSYNEFLGMLLDSATRKHLEGLRLDQRLEDETFQKARAFSHVFRDALFDLFFEKNARLAELTKNYGVF